jgi:hypothetical protein
MSADPPYTNEELMDAVKAIIAALSPGGQVNAAVSLDALAFVAAVIYDLDPTVTVPSQVRKAAEQQGSSVWTYLKFLRRHYEQTDTRFGEAIGGTVEVDPSILADVTRGMTKQ